MTKARQLADLGNAYDDGALSNRNLIINGKCSVNQRGNQTDASTSHVSGPDRFFLYRDATGYQIDVSQENDGPDGFGTCFQWKTSAVRTGSTTDQYTGFGLNFEIQDVIPYIWSKKSHVTASFWVKSSIAGDFAFNLNPDNTTSGGSGDRILYHAIYTVNAVNTWEYKSISIPLSFLDNYDLSSGYSKVDKGLEVTWVMDVSTGGTRDDAVLGWNPPATEARNLATSSTGATTGFFSTLNATFKITGIQLEVGDTATPFEHRSYADELAKCQRYFQVFKEEGTATFGVAFAFNANAAYDGSQQIFPVKMRASPSRSTSGAWSTTDGTGSIISITQFHGTTNSWGYQLGFSVASGLSQFRPYGIRALSGSGSQLKFDAEL